MLKLIHGTDLIVISSHEYTSEEVRTSKLMDLMAQGQRVYFFNRPIIGMTKTATFYYNKEPNKVTVVQPYLPSDISIFSRDEALIKVIKEFIKDEHIHHLTLWSDTPRSLHYARRLMPEVYVYDKVSRELVKPHYLEDELLNEAHLILNPKISMEELTAEIESLHSETETLPRLKETTEEVIKQRSLFSNSLQPRSLAISLYQGFEELRN